MEEIMVSMVPFYVTLVVYWLIFFFMPQNEKKHPILYLIRWLSMGACLGAEIMWIVLYYMIDGIA